MQFFSLYTKKREYHTQLLDCIKELYPRIGERIYRSVHQHDPYDDSNASARQQKIAKESIPTIYKVLIDMVKANDAMRMTVVKFFFANMIVRGELVTLDTNEHVHKKIVARIYNDIKKRHRAGGSIEWRWLWNR